MATARYIIPSHCILQHPVRVTVLEGDVQVCDSPTDARITQQLSSMHLYPRSDAAREMIQMRIVGGVAGTLDRQPVSVVLRVWPVVLMPLLDAKVGADHAVDSRVHRGVGRADDVRPISTLPIVGLVGIGGVFASRLPVNPSLTVDVVAVPVGIPNGLYLRVNAGRWMKDLIWTHIRRRRHAGGWSGVGGIRFMIGHKITSFPQAGTVNRNTPSSLRLGQRSDCAWASGLRNL